LWLSLTDAQVGEDGNFVGLANFRYLARQVGFHQALLNTLVYSGFSTAAKAVLGTGMALALARGFRGRRLVYALLFLPLIFPVTMGTVAWYYLFSDVHGAINYALIALGVIRESIPFLGRGNLPMISLITVNIWHGTALFGVLVLAGLRSIPLELVDAARIDGAGAGQRFLRILLPLLEPVLALAVLLSVLGTFGDYAIVHLLTNGGPANRTQIVSSFAFATALRDGNLSAGAAMVLALVPVYLVGLVYLLRRVARA
jgi:multiple sugar transport system permease protein